MQPGYPPPGQDPYGQPPQNPYGQPPPGYDPYAQPQHPQYGDPYAQPQQPPQPQYPQPQYGDPYGAPGQQPHYGAPQYPQYGDPYAQQPVSGDPYAQQPVSGDPYAHAAPGYPPQQYGGGYGAPATPSNNNFGMLTLIFGALGFLLALCCTPLGLLSSIVGVVLGVLGMRKAPEGSTTNRSMVLAGLIAGGLGAFIAIIRLAFFDSMGLPG